MALVYKDRVKETTTTTGTGTYSLGGAQQGFQSFSVIGTGNTCTYAVDDGTNWEVCQGTFTTGSPNTLSRDTILESSNSGSAVSWTSGTRNIYLTATAERILTSDLASTLASGSTVPTPTVGDNSTKIASTAFVAALGTTLRSVVSILATAGQTTFTQTYTPGALDVHVNGALLSASEYTATNGTSIVLNRALVLNDEVQFFVYAVSSLTNALALTGGTVSGAVTLSAGTASTSTSSGTLILTGSGGLGISGNINVGGNESIAGTATFSNGTNSTSSTTGSIILSGSGGIGVGGAVFAGGMVSAGTFFLDSVATSVSAAGTTQGTATAITKGVNQVTTCAAGAGVILPATPSTGSRRVVVYNDTANTCLVYPPSGAIVDQLAANLPVSLYSYQQAEYVSTSSNVYETLRTNTVAGAGVSVTPGSGITTIAVTAPLGQCKLVYTSTTTVTLTPYKGNLITIAGVNYIIPSAGVTLVSPTMTASTLYYIYAYLVGTTITLLASTTGHHTDTTTGVETWTTDNTHTLVGMVYCVTANTFTSTATSQLVRSWSYDPGVASIAAFTASRTTTSTTPVEVNSEIRNTLVLWAGEVISATTTGWVQSSTLDDEVITGIAFDSTTTNTVLSLWQAFAANAVGPCSVTAFKGGLVEGYHYVTLLGNVNAGTGTWTTSTDLVVYVPPHP